MSSYKASIGENFQDLRTWLKEVENLGLLKKLEGVDANLELGAITHMNAKSKKWTILFDKIKGYQEGFRVLVGVLLDSKRVALTFGLPTNITEIELVKWFRERMNYARKNYQKYDPEFVKTSPVMTHVEKGDKVNILKFPAPKWNEYDGGNYIGTAVTVITKDPETGWVNAGTYRLMVHNEKELGTWIASARHARLHMYKYFEKGEEVPVVISLGNHPALFAMSGIEVPHGVSEYNYLGAMIDYNWKVVEGPLTGLPIPADGEIVMEGYITKEMRDEGPFGEYYGYYAGGRTKQPVIRIEAVYYRDNPIILGTSPGRPPYDYSYYRCPVRAALIWEELEAAGIPGIQGVWAHEAGFSRAFNVISIKQLYAGHARQVGLIASACHAAAHGSRFTVVVDEDIDPSNLYDVIWAMSSRTDPEKGIDIIRDMPDTPLDPISERKEFAEEYSLGRVIIYACKPFSQAIRNTFPRTVEPSPELQKEVKNKWKEIF